MKILCHCVCCPQKFVDAKTTPFLMKDENSLIKYKRIWTKRKSIDESIDSVIDENI